MNIKRKDPNQYHSFFFNVLAFILSKGRQLYEPNCTFIVIYFIEYNLLLEAICVEFAQPLLINQWHYSIKANGLSSMHYRSPRGNLGPACWHDSNQTDKVRIYWNLFL